MAQPVQHQMLAPHYQVAWAGKEDPNADDVTEMMPMLMVFNVFLGLGGYFVWRLCKQRKVPFWETMIALWCDPRIHLSGLSIDTHCSLLQALDGCLHSLDP